MSQYLSLLLAFVLCATPAAAHEFWIEPDAHAVEPGAKVTAALRIGQNFAGDEYPFLSSQFRSFTLTGSEGEHPYEGNLGDRPALSTTIDTPGLTVITYHSKPSRLLYRKWETFLKYTANEGLTGAVEAHLDEGLPKIGFRESYARIAKSLIQAGPVRARDRDAARESLPFELVAVENPFDPSVETLTVRLLRQGEPAADVQVAVFAKAGEDVARTDPRTDDAGEVTIPLESGTRYLLNAVWLERVKRDGLTYASDWASLTFARP